MSGSADTTWHAPFLSALRQLPNLRTACQSVSVTRSLVQDHRKRDPAFDAAVEMALEDGRDTIRRIIAQRAIGERGADGSYRKGSDRMMELLAKIHLPELRARSITGANGEPLVPKPDPGIGAELLSRLTPETKRQILFELTGSHDVTPEELLPESVPVRLIGDGDGPN